MEETNKLLVSLVERIVEMNGKVDKLEYQIKSYKKNLDDRVSRIINDWRTKEEVETASILPPKTYEFRKFHKAYEGSVEEIDDEINDMVFEERIKGKKQ